MEYTVGYSPEMNGIAERINSLIATKARWLLLDVDTDSTSIKISVKNSGQRHLTLEFIFSTEHFLRHLNLTHLYMYVREPTLEIKKNTL